MSADSEYSEEEIRNMDEKEFRKEFPSGWMELSRYETLVLLIDKLLESNPSREYTPAELANQSGCSEPSVEEHIGSLVRLGVVNELEDREPKRYSLNEKSPITQKLYELNLTVEKVSEGELSKSISHDHKGKMPVSESKYNSASKIPERSQSELKMGEKQASEDTTPAKTDDTPNLSPTYGALGAD